MLNKPRAWLRRLRAAPRPAAEPSLPQDRIDRMYVSLRRRLSDRIEDVLDEACGIGDLQTAEELLSVLELMAGRAPRLLGRERRARTERLAMLRQEVTQLRERSTRRRRPSVTQGSSLAGE